MSEAARYVLIGFVVLLVVATGLYIDCRVVGGTPNACRVIYSNTEGFVEKVVPR